MKILIEGTKKEVETAKLVLESVCMFDREFCTLGKRCAQCEEEQKLEIECVIKNQ